MLRRLLIGLTVAIALALVAGVAWATIPSKDGTITACFGDRTGLVRIIDSDSGKCLRGETPISWNKTGPPGPPATTTYTIRSGQSKQGYAAQAFCLPGEKVTGGGALVLSDSEALNQNHPIADASGLIASGSDAIGWQAAATHWAPVQVYVVCAS